MEGKPKDDPNVSAEETFRIASQILSALDYDFAGSNPDRLARWLKQERGEEIHFIAFGFSSVGIDMFGFWVTDGKRQYICYEKDTPGVHQDFIKTHELMHIIAKHKTLNIGNQSIYGFLTELVSNPSTALLQMRSFHSTQDDVIAEAMARLVYKWQGQKTGKDIEAYLKSMDFV